MKLVIDIPEEDYKGICHLKNEQLRMLPEEVAETLMRIANGTPLPKGHGDLIDACQEMRLMQSYDYDTYEDYARAFDMLDNAPTVIEADKGETE